MRDAPSSVKWLSPNKAIFSRAARRERRVGRRGKSNIFHKRQADVANMVSRFTMIKVRPRSNLTSRMS